MSTLSGLKVAILVADGFEQVEMTEPRKALQEAGADTRIVQPVAQVHFDELDAAVRGEHAAAPRQHLARPLHRVAEQVAGRHLRHVVLGHEPLRLCPLP